MRKNFVASFLLALFLSCVAGGQTNNVRQIAPGVYVWEGNADKRAPANCTWVIFKYYVFVVDANFPWGGARDPSSYQGNHQ